MGEGAEGPTLADVLALLRGQGEALAGVAQRVESLRTGTGEGLDALAARIAAVDEKLDAGFLAVGSRFDLVDSRHLEVAQALEGLAELAHGQQAQLAGLREEVGGDVRAAEARLTSRLGDVQRLVQSLKGDLARHADDPDAHHRHAA